VNPRKDSMPVKVLIRYSTQNVSVSAGRTRAVMNAIFNIRKQIFLKMTTMASKEKIDVFHRNFKEFNILFDQALQKIISTLLLQISLCIS